MDGDGVGKDVSIGADVGDEAAVGADIAVDPHPDSVSTPASRNTIVDPDIFHSSDYGAGHVEALSSATELPTSRAPALASVIGAAPAAPAATQLIQVVALANDFISSTVLTASARLPITPIALAGPQSFHHPWVKVMITKPSVVAS